MKIHTVAGKALVVGTLGLLQIVAWGSSFYLLSVLAVPIAADTGWTLTYVVAGLTAALLAAGLVSPYVGRSIQTFGGRPVLATSSILLAAGLALLALSTSLALYFIAWLIIGLGMGAGLYDPAFATLGRLYGSRARQLITAITLFGGFASTVSWPASEFLLGEVGWRSTCWIYAAVNLFVGLPAYLFFLPSSPHSIDEETTAQGVAQSGQLRADRHRVALIVLGTILVVSAGTLSFISTHLLTLLQMRGFTLSAAVAIGALVGPSQVGARVLELLAGRSLHPLWSMLAGTVVLASGVLLLWGTDSAVALAVIGYGAGNGISSIVRGTVPLILFGASRYAVLLGRLGLPILLSMAAAPPAGALLIQLGGPSSALAVLSGFSILNIALVLALIGWCRPGR